MPNSLDNIKIGDQLLTNLGTFWSNVFQGSGTLQQYTRGLAQGQAQNYLNYLEAVATLSRFTVPVFHRENWVLLTVTQSQVAGVASIYQSNDLVYGPQPGTVADRPAGFVQTYNGRDKPGIVEIPLPAQLVDAPYNLQNYVLKPTKVWVNGIDYYIDKTRNILVFRNNPFIDPQVPQRIVFNQQGVQVDVEIALWVYVGTYDLDQLYTYFGYALGVKLPSTEFYRSILNAFWDMHLLGPSLEQFEFMLAALAGETLVINPTETVVALWTDGDNKLVMTDFVVYQFPTTATIIVTVGQVVNAGDSLTDAVEIFELNGEAPVPSAFSALALDKSFIDGNYVGPLTFVNANVALDYLGTDANGKTVVAFEVSGFPGDVTQFFGRVQANGEKPGQSTLAELLDTRANPVGQPGPSNLPATVNPLGLVLELMKNNLFFIEVNLASFDETAPGVMVLNLLREVMPPNVNYVVKLGLTVPTEVADLGEVGTTDSAGADDAATPFTNATPPAEVGYEIGSAVPGFLAYGDVAYARLYSLTCQ